MRELTKRENADTLVGTYFMLQFSITTLVLMLSAVFILMVYLTGGETSLKFAEVVVLALWISFYTGWMTASLLATNVIEGHKNQPYLVIAGLVLWQIVSLLFICGCAMNALRFFHQR